MLLTTRDPGRGPCSSHIDIGRAEDPRTKLTNSGDDLEVSGRPRWTSCNGRDGQRSYLATLKMRVSQILVRGCASDRSGLRNPADSDCYH